MHGTKATTYVESSRGPTVGAASFEPHETRFEISRWPNDQSLTQGVVVSLTRMALPFHDFDLGRAGNFAQSNAAHKFESSIRSDVNAVTLGFLTQNNASSRLTKQIRKESDKYGNARYGYPVEALTGAEIYNIETGT